MQKVSIYCIAHFTDGRVIFQTRWAKRLDLGAAAFIRFIRAKAEKPLSQAKSFEFSDVANSDIAARVRSNWQTAEVVKPTDRLRGARG